MKEQQKYCPQCGMILENGACPFHGLTPDPELTNNTKAQRLRREAGNYQPNQNNEHASESSTSEGVRKLRRKRKVVFIALLLAFLIIGAIVITGNVTDTIKRRQNNFDDFKESILLCDFETDEQGWISFGSDSVSICDEEAADGARSLLVDGRKEPWNGAALLLGSEFLPGHAFAFSVKDMQKSNSSTLFKLTMKYSTKDGEHFDEIARARSSNGQWVVLENMYTIPEEATCLTLYVEVPDSLTDFYIDSVDVRAVVS